MQRDKIKPILFSIIKHSSKEELKEQLPRDIVSGIVVAIVALPLSIALAIASGVGPEQGLCTAIVAGFLIAFLGGSRVQISGPTAAFATIVAGIVATDGIDGLVAATLIAGVLLVVMGLLKLGTIIRFVPYTITTGFTAGIAVTIVIGQLKDFFGLTYPAARRRSRRPTRFRRSRRTSAPSIGRHSWWVRCASRCCFCGRAWARWAPKFPARSLPSSWAWLWCPCSA